MPLEHYFYWRHKESTPVAIAQGSMATAKAGTWAQLNPEMRARQLRMFVIITMQAASVSNSTPLGVLGPAVFHHDEERIAAGATVARSLHLFLPPKLKTTVITKPFDTVEGLPPTSVDDEAGAISVATVLMVTACAIVAGFIAHEVAVVADNKYFQEEKTKRLVAGTAKAVEAMALHVEREKVAGKLLPFSEEERSLLENLQGIQKELAAEQNRPFPTPFDGAREFLSRAADSAAVLLPLALGAAAFFVLTSNDKRREVIHV